VSAGDGWTGVTWSDLDPVGADAVIAAQISRFAELSDPWEWKHYSYDQPPDLPDRLLAAGFTREPAEALLVAEIADLTLDVPPPLGVEVRAVIDRAGVDALVSVQDKVFGEDHSALGKALVFQLPPRRGDIRMPDLREPPTCQLDVALVERRLDLQQQHGLLDVQPLWHDRLRTCNACMPRVGPGDRRECAL
jgi:hypothetical protein